MKESKVRELLRNNNRTWEDFIEFMTGQTLGMYEDGSTNFYECDVEKFILCNENSFNWD